MILSTYCRVFAIVFIPSLTSSTSSEIRRCLKDIFDLQRDNVIITSRDVMTSERAFCVLELRSQPGTHVTLTIDFTPHRGISTNCSRDDYIHIGNDRDRIDKTALTSYRFCNETVSEEIVSRGSYLWVVFKVSNRPRLFRIDAFSSSKAHDYKGQVQIVQPITYGYYTATCNSTEFQCSPVQCVSLDKVCDGTPDCNNTRDEFCHAGISPPSGPPCFRCGNGQCIRPHLPRYSLDYGKELWYLCDGFRHCPDGSDERKDICFRMKGRTSVVMSCVPSDVINPAANPVLMWNNVLCNGKRDCYHGNDEFSEKCQKGEKNEFSIDKGAVGFVVLFLVLAVTVGIVIAYRAKNRRRQAEDSSLQGVLSEADVSESQPHERVPLHCDSGAAVFDTVGLRQTTV